jgi:hypothetical protein
MEFWRTDYPVVDGKYQDGVKSSRLSVWAPVRIATGEVDMDNLHVWDDDLTDLCDGWEWREFVLSVPDADSRQGVA